MAFIPMFLLALFMKATSETVSTLQDLDTNMTGEVLPVANDIAALKTTARTSESGNHKRDPRNANLISNIHKGKDLIQTKAEKFCIEFEWFGLRVVGPILELNVTNSLTKEMTSHNISSVSRLYKVCNLMEHQRYWLELSTVLDHETDSRDTIAKYMWTKQIVPDYPSEPVVIDASPRTLKLKIFWTKFDENKGPWTGFDIRIIRTADLEPSRASRRRRRRQASKFHGVPPANTIGFLKRNEDQEVTIGEGETLDKALERDTEYTIFVGVVSTLVGRSTHAYVSTEGTTTTLNIHLIVATIFFLLSILLLLFLFLFTRWMKERREEERRRLDRQGMLLYLGSPQKNDDINNGEDVDEARKKDRTSEKLVGVLGSPEIVGRYVHGRHPEVSEEWDRAGAPGPSRQESWKKE